MSRRNKVGAAFTDDGFAMGKDSLHEVYITENESYTVSLEFVYCIFLIGVTKGIEKKIKFII